MNAKIKYTDILHGVNIKFSKVLPAKLKCKKCTKVVINAHISSCGCTYCKDCIDQHLRKTDKCVGRTKLCNKVILESNSFTPNIDLDKEVENLIMFCPNEECNEKIEVKNIFDHLKSCNFSVVCKFADYGCDVNDLTVSEMKVHLKNQAEHHAYLTFEQMAIISNENNLLKNKVEELENTVKTLTSQTFESQVIYDWVVSDYYTKYGESCQNAYSCFVSPPFYLGGYHFNMILYPNYKRRDNNTYTIGTALKIIEGDYDNQLHWPCKRKFIIKIHNVNRVVTITDHFKTNNYMSAVYPHIPSKDVLSPNSPVLQNGQMCIRCIIE